MYAMPVLEVAVAEVIAELDFVGHMVGEPSHLLDNRASGGEVGRLVRDWLRAVHEWQV